MHYSSIIKYIFKIVQKRQHKNTRQPTSKLFYILKQLKSKLDSYIINLWLNYIFQLYTSCLQITDTDYLTYLNE